MEIIKKLINRVLEKTVSITEVAVLGIAVIATISYALAWNPPSGNPPANNADAPLNIGSTGQIKSGGLLVGAGAGVTTGLIVQNGNVGIGTASPQVKLHVQGDAVITGNLNINGTVNGLKWGGDCTTIPDFQADDNTMIFECPQDYFLTYLSLNCKPYGGNICNISYARCCRVR